MTSTTKTNVPGVPSLSASDESTADNAESTDESDGEFPVDDGDGHQNGGGTPGPETQRQEQADADRVTLETVSQQARFGDGELETDDEVETSLDEWGLDVGREKETKYEKEKASEFGVDDREQTGDEGRGNTEQTKLFPDTDDNQLTLTGERANTQSLYEQKQRRKRRQEADDSKDEEERRRHNPWEAADDNNQEELDF